MPRTLKALFTAALLGAALTVPALADGPPETPAYQPPPAQQQGQTAPAPSDASVRAAPLQPAADASPRTGQVTLPNGVTLNVPAGFHLLSAAEAQAFLQRANQPAPRGDILGLLAPIGADPAAADFWGSVISYDAIGYVPPNNAAALSARNFEADVRAARQGAGRTFVNFEQAPAFDPAGSLSWAERTAQPAEGVRNVRHEQRMLGRSGVLGLTTIGRSDQLGQMIAAIPTFVQSLAFAAGQRYADATDQDRRAPYDLPGMVTGVPRAEAATTTAQGFVQTNAASEKGGAGLQGLFPWIAIAVVLLAALGWFAMGRRNRDIDDVIDEDEDDEPAREPAPEPARRIEDDPPAPEEPRPAT
ncbi:MAG: DUF2167 domain-containing protein [Hyphomonadaceae bacterium]